MLHTKGIVFRTVRFQESSLIVDVYTEEKGLMSFFMNSVFHSKNSRLSSLLQIGQSLDLVAYYSDKKELHRIKEVSPDYIYSSLPNHIHKAAVATFIIELCRHCIKGQTPNPELFQYIRRCLILLDRQEDFDPNFHLKFMIRFCSFIGFNPVNNFSESNNSFDLMNAHFTSFDIHNKYCVDIEKSKNLNKLLNDEYSSEKTLHLQYEARSQMLELLILYYKLHIEQFGELKSPSVYKSIL
ncbi:MAG: DNA repair protein RecO [Saprospiraceae bacterium]|nr:DNA repair protein RecO [Saprospiraceae bacterium]